MQILSDSEKQAIWDEVSQEFPNDETMQQVHYVRLLHYYQTQGMTAEQKKAFYRQTRHKKIA